MKLFFKRGLLLLCLMPCRYSIYAQTIEMQAMAFLNDSAIRTGHAGISIFEPATGKYLYSYNADKNFTAGSTLKLFTLYAGMKYLGDSLPGLNYFTDSGKIYIVPTGDPTLLHPDFIAQPIINFLKNYPAQIILQQDGFAATPYGAGWAWEDYVEDFMPERSAMPIYGNLISIRKTVRGYHAMPANDSLFHISISDSIPAGKGQITRALSSNSYVVSAGISAKQAISIPFITSIETAIQLIADSIHKKIIAGKSTSAVSKNSAAIKKLFSRPVDSLFRPMMYKSDNFFAEQTLLMVSKEKLGYMSDVDLIDTLLRTDFRDMPTKPRWVDGSGLSRYNLFSPKDFIYILNKLQHDFGLARLKRILPSGGMGTLINYYESDAGYIYAKTGSMSNNVSLSGYLTTKSNKQLLFSILVNNYSGSGREGRRAIEKFIQGVRQTN